MKRIFFLFIGVLAVSFMSAGNREVIVKGITPTGTGKTEISGGSDTLVVIPAVDVTNITVTVTDVDGEVLSEQVLPANMNINITVQTPSLPGGCLFEISDNKGVVYTEFEP